MIVFKIKFLHFQTRRKHYPSESLSVSTLFSWDKILNKINDEIFDIFIFIQLFLNCFVFFLFFCIVQKTHLFSQWSIYTIHWQLPASSCQRTPLEFYFKRFQYFLASIIKINILCGIFSSTLNRELAKQGLKVAYSQKQRSEVLIKNPVVTPLPWQRQEWHLGLYSYSTIMMSALSTRMLNL